MVEKAPIRLLAEVIAGALVPLSMPGHPLGAAERPLLDLRAKLNLFGWHTADETERVLRLVIQEVPR